MERIYTDHFHGITDELYKVIYRMQRQIQLFDDAYDNARNKIPQHMDEGIYLLRNLSHNKDERAATIDLVCKLMKKSKNKAKNNTTIYKDLKRDLLAVLRMIHYIHNRKADEDAQLYFELLEILSNSQTPNTDGMQYLYDFFNEDLYDGLTSGVDSFAVLDKMKKDLKFSLEVPPKFVETFVKENYVSNKIFRHGYNEIKNAKRAFSKKLRCSTGVSFYYPQFIKERAIALNTLVCINKGIDTVAKWRKLRDEDKIVYFFFMSATDVPVFCQPILPAPKNFMISLLNKVFDPNCIRRAQAITPKGKVSFAQKIQFEVEDEDL